MFFLFVFLLLLFFVFFVFFFFLFCFCFFFVFFLLFTFFKSGSAQLFKRTRNYKLHYSEIWIEVLLSPYGSNTSYCEDRKFLNV